MSKYIAAFRRNYKNIKNLGQENTERIDDKVIKMFVYYELVVIK